MRKLWDIQRKMLYWVRQVLSVCFKEKNKDHYITSAERVLTVLYTFSWLPCLRMFHEGF